MAVAFPLLPRPQHHSFLLAGPPWPWRLSLFLSGLSLHDVIGVSGMRHHHVAELVLCHVKSWSAMLSLLLLMCRLECIVVADVMIVGGLVVRIVVLVLSTAPTLNSLTRRCRIPSPSFSAHALRIWFMTQSQPFSLEQKEHVWL